MTNALHRFLRDERANQSVEFVLVFPIVFAVFLSIFVYTDAFRVRAALADGTATAADALSRETDPIDETYLAGLQSVMRFLVPASVRMDLRVTQITCAADCDDLDARDLTLIFSRHRDWTALTAGAFAPGGAYRGQVPLIGVGDTLLLVEARMWYAPIFDIGLAPDRIESFTLTRMRFAPRLCWIACNT